MFKIHAYTDVWLVPTFKNLYFIRKSIGAESAWDEYINNTRIMITTTVIFVSKKFLSIRTLVPLVSTHESKHCTLYVMLICTVMLGKI